ncbi:hypothetical protein [Propionicimonas sp.]|uniref:hypothetical protein n=1 Tax=Propionicimonas sp. TaxID=1955623 RepID=UPI0039E34282
MTTSRTAQLFGSGMTRHDLDRAVQRGELVRVRHGAWSEPGADGDLQQHRLLLEGTWPLLGEGAVLSHGSAGVPHGLPVWPALLERVSITRSGGGHGARTRNLHVRRAPLAPPEVQAQGGYRVTSLERTAVDLARLLSYERAVAVLDAALHAQADAGLLDETVRAAVGRSGAATARRALAFADGRAESVGESVSRVRMAQVRLPAPDLQTRVFDAAGRFVARCDFCWPGRRVIGEFDGAVKYTGTPEEVAAAVMAEKRRQTAIEALGWLVVRWTWSELFDAEAFRVKIAAALARGGSPVR